MIDVLVTGAAGRMGREVVKAVTAAEGMRVAAAVDPHASGVLLDDGTGGTITVSPDLMDAITAHRPQVMVDFSIPAAVEANVSIALGAGISCIVGTTGVDLDRWRSLASRAVGDACLFIAPNFAIGAVLMMRFAQTAARFMPHVEVIELHHDRKLDAPSGTAMRTAALIAEARAEAPVAPGRETEIVEGARGAEVDGVHVHSIRLPGLVAHQEVLFGDVGQTLSLRHDSIDRTSFMPGVVLAIRGTVGRSGLVVGLEELMGL